MKKNEKKYPVEKAKGLNKKYDQILFERLKPFLVVFMRGKTSNDV